MSHAPHEQDVIVGLPPTPEGDFYVAWGQETFKRNLTFANEVLRSLLTVSASMLGGSAAFLHNQLPPVALTLVAILFLVAMLVALVGVLPHEGQVDLRIPEAIRRHKKAALEKKLKFIEYASMFLIAGFIIAFGGIVGRR